MGNIKPITLEIDEELWTLFKKQVPRDIRLNDAVVDLIQKYVRLNKMKEASRK